MNYSDFLFVRLFSDIFNVVISESEITEDDLFEVVQSWYVSSEDGLKSFNGSEYDYYCQFLETHSDKIKEEILNFYY